jgi:HEAT repeat protein
MTAIKNSRCLKLDWAIYLRELELRIFGGANLQVNEGKRDQLSVEEANFQSLLEKTQHHSSHIRRQAARELGVSSHPKASKALIDLLKDGNHDVSWAATHSLISLRRGAVRPLLEELTRDFQSSCFRKAAHHIFRELNRLGDLNEHEAHVLHSLSHDDKGLTIAQRANKALISSQKHAVETR